MGDLADALAGPMPRVLTLDIETSPNVADVWGLFNQNIGISQLRDSSRVLCFAAKWHEKKAVEFYSEHDVGHAEMVTNAWRLLDAVDILVTFNGPSFDVKHLQREFLLAGLGPPSPWRNVDLLRVVRGQFKFTSNKLAHVADRLGIGGKTPHTGHQMWTDVLAGDEKAWRLFRKYCVQDVRLTERLYDELAGRGWIKDHPHAGLWTGADRCCPTCGSEDLRQDGRWYSTPVSQYALMTCQKCGTHCRMNHVHRRVVTRPAR